MKIFKGIFAIILLAIFMALVWWLKWYIFGFALIVGTYQSFKQLKGDK